VSDKQHKHIGDPFDCLAEECAEVIQVLMKLKRFGMFNHHPDKPKFYDNKMALQDEMKDVADRIAQVTELLKDMHPDYDSMPMLENDDQMTVTGIP